MANAAPVSVARGNGIGSARRSFRVAAVLLIVGEVLYAAVTPLWHPGGDPDPVGEFGLYAASQTWTLVHTLQFASAALITFGLLALARGVDAGSGVSGLLTRFGSATAVAALGVSGVLYAVDGVALKEAADAWVTAPPGAQPVFLSVVEGIRGIEWGLRGYADYAMGLAVLLLAVGIATRAQLPRALGYLWGVIGLLYIVHGVGYASSYSALSDHSLLGTTTYVLTLLVLAWAIWLAVSAWRPASDDARSPADAATSTGPSASSSA